MRKKLSLLLIACLVLPTLLGWLIALSSADKKADEEAKVVLKDTANQNADELEYVLVSQKNQLARVISNIKLINAVTPVLNGKQKSFTEEESTGVLRIMLGSVSDVDYCEQLTLLDHDGNVLVSTDAKMEKSDCADIIAKQTASENDCEYQLVKRGGKYCWQILYTFQNSEGLMGYMVAEMELKNCQFFFSTVTNRAYYDILVNDAGDCVYNSTGKQIGDKIEVESMQSVVNDYNSGNAERWGSFSEKINGKKGEFVYFVIPELNAAYIMAEDVTQRNRNRVSEFYVLLIYVILLSVIAVVAAPLVAARLTKPVLELTETMKMVSNGDFNVRSEVKQKDEIGELASRFNKMIQIIQSSYDDMKGMRDVLEENQKEIQKNYKHIEHLAYHDALTDLNNKSAFYERVSHIIDTMDENDSHGVMFMDLDNFKTINDTKGHDYGDAILVKTAERIKALANPGDCIARIGGDEFLIFRQNSTEEELKHFAAKLLSTFREPFHIKDETMHVSASIGIARSNVHGKTMGSLIKNADIAMYRAKAAGKNRYAIFDAQMEKDVNREAEILEVLRGAIANNSVHMNYQMQIDSANKQIKGYEALMRLTDPELGVISPDEFIPIAEESGIILELGEWALRENCRFNKELMDKGILRCPVAVNISAVQLNQTGFVEQVRRILNETGLPAKYLELEITESTLITSLVDTNEVFNQLQELGVNISLDDFGTGFSPLTYLTNLPIDKLKIDKSFIDRILEKESHYNVVDMIIDLSHKLNITVIAEGVETEEQYALLRELNCDLIQGYLFSKTQGKDAFIDSVLSKSRV
ncbi:MAG: EAL domain-containing protein [Lachnospiraceae bacterium]|nr:EAL domain-containing protein [Lachnospiraceae bacterium]